MRAWHTKLIPHLCNVHLTAMWKETGQMLDTIKNKKKSWYNHPATKEFHHCPDKLWDRRQQVLQESQKRGLHFNPDLLGKKPTMLKEMLDKNKKEFHYTNEQMVIYLLKITPIKIGDSVLDAGSGKGYKPWFNNLSGEKYECELDDGCDFLKWDKKVDWVIGNPPYHQSWKFTEQALKIANKGIAWLVNNQALNSHLTPARLDKMKEQGFEYTNIHIVADKRWFGRYYFIILQKKKGILTWERKTY